MSLRQGCGAVDSSKLPIGAERPRLRNLEHNLYNPVSGTLEPLRASSSYLAFEHWWATILRSTLAAGLVRVDNQGGQPDDALQGSDQLSLNLAWSPIRRVDLMTEVLWGRRFNKNGAQGHTTQFQLGSTFRFSATEAHCVLAVCGWNLLLAGDLAAPGHRVPASPVSRSTRSVPLERHVGRIAAFDVNRGARRRGNDGSVA